MNPLIIRADASPEIGTGHVMRCLALAEAWQDTGGKVFFVSACDTPALEVRLKKEGIQIFHIRQETGSLDDAGETAQIAHELGADWIVVDGYHFGAEYQKTIKNSGLSLLFIDDFGHADHYYADIVLNQNVYANMSFYKNYESYTRFLLGTKYALIRMEFLKWSDWHRDIPGVARKILITLGGSDPDNVTLKAIEAVKTLDISGLEVIVVVGGINQHFNLINSSVKDRSNISLITDAGNMPELFAWADIAISAGGSTTLEIAFMGLPSIIIITAENQILNATALEKKGVIKNLGWHENATLDTISNVVNQIVISRITRGTISDKAKQLVDGKAARSVTELLRCYSVT